MGVSVIVDVTKKLAVGVGLPASAQAAISRQAQTRSTWGSKPATEAMRYFKKQLERATWLGSWTANGMAVEHLRHYLDNSGLDYRVDMNRFLANWLVRRAYDKIIDQARVFAQQEKLRPGDRFHSKETWQVIPRQTANGRPAGLEDRDVWYSVGTFAAWVDGIVLSDGLMLTLHLLDIYDWDQTDFTLPIPETLCGRLDNVIVEATVGKIFDKLREDGTIKINPAACTVIAEDWLMNDLHLMGLAQNYLTRGSIEQHTTL